MRIAEMTWMQVEEYLLGDDRCILPLGSTEQHAYLSLAVDVILPERVAVEAAEAVGIPVFPTVPYGLTPYFMAYPGTVTLSPTTYGSLIREILDSLHHHGFRRILVVNGHGGNRSARPVAEEWAAEKERTTVRWHDWWAAPKTMAAVRSIDADASHASWMEGFPWTQIVGANPPAGHKPAVDLAGREEWTAEQLRERLGDGSFGGYYTRPGADYEAVWSVAVAEVRRQIVEGW